MRGTDSTRRYRLLGHAMPGLFAAALLSVLLCTPPADAAEGDKVSKEITGSRMLDIMKAAGYSVDTDDDGDIVWMIEGYRSFMLIADDNLSVQFHAAFGDGNATLEKVNEWNRTKKYSRSYLDPEGDPHLELDLDFTGGVTHDRILDFLMTCRISYAAWIKEVVK